MPAEEKAADAPEAPASRPGRFDLPVWRFNDEPMPKVAQTGGCHCGAVRFRVQHEPLTRQPGFHVFAKMCNCSICARNGYLLIYPRRDELEWLAGADAMTAYRFATGTKAHRFCPRCGSSVCMDPEGSWNSWAGDVVGINVRMLDDWDIADLNIHEKDGKNFVPS